MDPVSLLIGAMVLSGVLTKWIQDGRTDRSYAQRGMVSPRHQLRLARLEAAGRPASPKERGPLRNLLSEYYADALLDLQERHRAKRAVREPYDPTRPSLARRFDAAVLAGVDRVKASKGWESVKAAGRVLVEPVGEVRGPQSGTQQENTMPQGEHYYQIFFQRDLHTRRPMNIVAWRVWRGGFEEVTRWPWDAVGCADAGRWAVEHRAWLRGAFGQEHPINSADELMVHADTGESPIQRQVGERHTDDGGGRTYEWDGKTWRPVCSRCGIAMRGRDAQSYLTCEQCGVRATDDRPEPPTDGNTDTDPTNTPTPTGEAMTTPIATEASTYETATVALGELTTAAQNLSDHVAGAVAAAGTFTAHVEEISQAKQDVAEAVASVLDQLGAQGVDATTQSRINDALDLINANDLTSALDHIDAATAALSGSQTAATEAASATGAAQESLTATYGDVHDTMATHGTAGSFVGV